MKFASAAVAVILQGAKSVSSVSAGGGDGGENDRRWVPFDNGAFNIDRRRDGENRKTNQQQQRQQRGQSFFRPVMNGNTNNNRIRNKLHQKQSQIQRNQGQVFGREGQQLQLQLKNRFQPLQKKQQQQQLSRPVVMQECDPDLGILACGRLHEYCVSSSRSTSGGFCMDFAGGGGGRGGIEGSSSPFTSSGARINANQRLLQDTEEEGDDDAFNSNNYNNNNNNYGVDGNLTCSCSPECYYPYEPRDRWENAYAIYCQDGEQYRSPYRNCTCTNVDRDTYTLRAECTSGGYNSDYCFESFNVCGVNYTSCPGGSSNTIEIAGEDTYFSEFCSERNDVERCSSFYQKRDADEGTYLFKSCTFFDGADVCNTIVRSNETYLAESCEIEVNGETCSSCDVVDVVYDGCKYYSDPLYCSNFTVQCYEYDCTSTDLNRTGSTCNRTYGYVYYSNTDGCDKDCNVCGDDATMTLPDEYFEIPFYGRIQCSRSQTRATNGALSTNGCAAVQLLAFDPCGCVEIEGDSSRSSSLEEVPSTAEGRMGLSEIFINLGLSAVIASSFA